MGDIYWSSQQAFNDPQSFATQLEHIQNTAFQRMMMSHDVGHLQNPTHLTTDAVDLSAPARPQRVRRRHAPR